MKRINRYATVCALALAALPALAEEVDLTLPLSEGANVKVINVAGEIVIHGWDKPEVRVTGRLGPKQELKTIESSSGILFEVANARGDDDYDAAELELWVPAGANLVAEAISADVTIEGAGGDNVVAESVSGDVTVAAQVSRAEISSVSGDVRFSGSAARGQFETVSGDISASGVDGEVSVSTVSGDAELAAGRLERGQFETVSGTLELALELLPGGRVTAQAMSGDVRLSLPPEQQGEFTVQTFSGDIRSEYGSAEKEGFGPGRRLRHVEGSSGAQFRIESFSGDVTIRKR